MSLATYLIGALYLTATVGLLGLATALLARRRLGDLSGAPRVLGLSVIFTFALLAAHLAPGVLGVLRRETVLAASALILAAAALVPPDPRAEPQGESSPPPGGPISWGMATLALVAFVVYVLATARDKFGVAPTSIDTLTFHLPNVARWIQTGTFWQADDFVPNLTFGNFPQNGDVIQLAAALPWRDDFATHLTPYPFLLLAGLAVYAIGCELGAPRPTSIIVSVSVLTVPVIAATALVNGMPDAVLLAAFATGILFLLRHVRTGRTSDLVLAGLGLGIAFGTKWYGVSSVPGVVLVWLVASLAARKPTGQVIRQALLLTALIALAGGFWLLRNWVESGNPVFPVRVAPFGITIFDAPYDGVRRYAGFTLARYILEPDIWSTYLWPQFKAALGLPALVTLGGALLALAVALRRKGGDPRVRRSAGLVLAVFACLVVLVAIYLNTPYTGFGPEGQPSGAGVNTRYLGPALLVAAALTAWGAGRLGAAGLLIEAALLVAIVDGINKGYAPDIASWARAAGILVAIGVVAIAVVHLKRQDHSRGPKLVAASLVATLVLVAAAEYAGQRRVISNRYREHDPSVDWILAHAPSGHRIGLAGQWNVVGISPVRPAFGDRAGNTVSYVGRYVREMLREYEHRTPFIRALREERYDLLIVGRGGGFPEPVVEEEQWARHAGYERVLDSERLALYRLRGSRTPDTEPAGARGARG